MNKPTTILMLLMAAMGSMAQDNTTVCSPDGKLRVNFELKNGQPVYGVTYEGRQVLDESPLGFTSNHGDFTKGLTITGTRQSDKPLTTSYTLNRSKQSQVSKEYNEMEVTLENGAKGIIGIQFRVENNDIAFRYRIPKQNGIFSIRIMDEKTGFDLPHSTTTFLCPQSDAMVGWKGTKPSYEEEYKFDEPMTTRSQFGHGYTFPCLFHINDDKADGNDKGKKSVSNDLWVLISETGLDSHYCGGRLSDMKGDGLYKLEFPMAEENSGNGTVEPALPIPCATPWRTITVGSTLKPVTETTIAWDFVEQLYEPSTDYRFGKGTWSWIVWQDNSICWDDQVKYIALAKEMGFQYVLIDNWWDNNIGQKRMEDLVKYSQSQGVDVFLWYSSSGWWNDIEQGPINIMCDPITRKKYMKWMKDLGVKGIKVDFFGGDKQETIRLYEQILSDANDYGIMVIFHGCTIPRGWERMYPNYVGSEAVLASENLYFSQHFCDVEAQNTALHPFVRNAIGCMEFGGCFMNRNIHRGNKGGNVRRTTDCHELATTVLFQNPIQNFAITPENIWGGKAADTKVKIENMEQQHGAADYNADGAAAPELCMEYLKKVPTTWDETRFIEGYPGKYCVLARRHGDTWYIAGNNNTGAPLKVTLNSDILQKGDRYALYSDIIPKKPNGKLAEPSLTQGTYNGKALTVTMADQGGFVIVK